MKLLYATMLAASTALCATAAMAEAGDPCSTPGAVVTIGGKRFMCSGAAGQANNPNWDGRSKQPTQPVAIPQPKGISTQQAVFPGISPKDYQKLQNSPEGKALIKQADDLRAQQAQAQKDYD